MRERKQPMRARAGYGAPVAEAKPVKKTAAKKTAKKAAKKAPAKEESDG